MELANLERDEQRNLELSRDIADENHQKVAELQRQKAAHDALTRKGLHSSNTIAPRVSPKKVLPVPGDSNWGGPMNLRHGNVTATGTLNQSTSEISMQDMAQMHMKEMNQYAPQYDPQKSFAPQQQQPVQVRPAPKVRPPQPSSSAMDGVNNESWQDVLVLNEAALVEPHNRTPALRLRKLESPRRERLPLALRVISPAM